MIPPASGELHLWLRRRETGGTSGQFLRQVLARYANVSPQQLQLTRGRYGKPALVSPAMALEFNVSHSGEWQALVVSDGSAVGIDLEYCDPARDVLKLARRCFSGGEVADLQACTATQCVDRFYDYWTLKEAHIKAGGGPLGRALEATSFALHYRSHPSGGEVAGSIVALTPAPVANAWYCLLQPLSDYRLALCCQLPPGTSPMLSLFESPLYAPHTPPLRAVSGVATSAARHSY